jgi:catechol 2,3-dioxygenase-like lactoylglutathione lyase family enzyme
MWRWLRSFSEGVGPSEVAHSARHRRGVAVTVGSLKRRTRFLDFIRVGARKLACRRFDIAKIGRQRQSQRWQDHHPPDVGLHIEEVSMNDVSLKVRPLTPSTQPISPAQFAHFVLRTGQIDRLAEWYQTVLAARIVFRDERLCFLSYDDEHHRLALIQIPGLPVRDPDAVGTDHVAYSYRDLGELLSTYRRLKAAGILPHWPINHGVTTSMYYRDPDNNRVELQIDNFATPAELDGYFHSDAFAANPVGVTYDPEQLVRDYEAGVPISDLLRIPPLPQGKTPWDMLAQH